MQCEYNQANAENHCENSKHISQKSEDTDGLQNQMPSSIIGNDETNMLPESRSYERGEGQNTRTGGENDTFEISMPESP